MVRCSREEAINGFDVKFSSAPGTYVCRPYQVSQPYSVISFSADTRNSSSRYCVRFAPGKMLLSQRKKKDSSVNER